jgi:hypothetical protein
MGFRQGLSAIFTGLQNYYSYQPHKYYLFVDFDLPVTGLARPLILRGLLTPTRFDMFEGLTVAAMYVS